MRPIPWDESPADLESRLLERQSANDFESECVSVLERGEELPPHLAERIYGWES